MNLLFRYAFILSLFSITSCSSLLYGPDTNRINNPSKKGDARISAGITLTPRMNNLSTELSYSPKQQFGTQLFVNYGDKYKTVGVGAGVYKSKNTYEGKVLRKSSVFDLYFAYSYNRSHGIVNDNIAGEFRYDYKYHDYSFQGSMNFFHKNVGINIGYRPHLINIISADVYGDTKSTTRDAINNLNNGPFLFQDILGKLYFGKKGINLYLGCSISISPDKIRELNDPISVTTGFNFNISEIFK